VKKEIELASHHSFNGNQLQIFIVWLDKTPLPPEFDHKHAFKLEDCSEDKISELIDQLPADMRRFSFDKKLEQQYKLPVDNTPLVRVAFNRNKEWGFKADLVGLPAQRFPKYPDVLHVAVQFRRDVNLNLVNDIYKAVGTENNPIWVLHIMGKRDASGKSYHLDENIELWQAACSYIK